MKYAKDKKFLTILTVISILLFIVITIGASFAFFTARVSGISNNIRIETAQLGSASASGTSVSLYVTSNDMLEKNGRNDYTAYKESLKPATLSVVATSGDQAAFTRCTYDLVYKPYQVYNKSNENYRNLKEFSIRGYQNITYTNTVSYITGALAETNLNDVATKIKLVTGATITIVGARKTSITTWYITPRYYNLALNQDDNADKTFGGTIEVGRLVCLQERG